jgi:hypothetical protein
MTANPEQVPDEPVCSACGGRGDLHNDDCVALAMGVPVKLQVGDGSLDLVGTLTPQTPIPLGIALAEFLRGFAQMLEEKYAEQLASGALDVPAAQLLQFVVLRAPSVAPAGWLPEFLEGRWLAREAVALGAPPLWYRGGQPVPVRLEETERIEGREDGALAQVWEVYPE